MKVENVYIATLATGIQRIHQFVALVLTAFNRRCWGSYRLNCLKKGKELKDSLRNSIQNPESDGALSQGKRLSLLRTSRFFFLALFSVRWNRSKMNYTFKLILYFFKIFASALCRPQEE